MNCFREFETPRACPVCAGTATGRIRWGDVARCGDCGVYYRSPRPTQAEIRRMYDAGRTYAWWEPEEAIRRRLWRRRMELVRPHLPSGRLLDVSTGDAHFLAVCAEAGIEAEATEFSGHGAQLSRRRGFAVRVGALEEIDFGERRFAAVTLWHVLEHVPDVAAVLRRSRELLEPGGLLAVAVPNEDDALLRRALGRGKGRHPFGDLHWGGEIHLTHFQPATLKAALRIAGFRLIEFGVDDVQTKPDWRTRLAIRAQGFLSAATGWHFSRAMYALARRA